MEWRTILSRSHQKARIFLTEKGEEDMHLPPTDPEAGDGTYKLSSLGEMVLETADDSESEEEEGINEQIMPEGPCTLIIRRNCYVAPVEKQSEQRENIFQTKARIHDELCDVIIDSGSETNCVDRRLVDRLGLKTTRHPHPYKLQWLDDASGQHVRKQGLVEFKIGSYHDKVVCDVLNMDACHVLLGRPWQHDRKSKHDGYTNVYTIKDLGKKKDLLPLPPAQAIPPPKDKRAHVTRILKGVAEEKEKTQRAITKKREIQEGKRVFKAGEFVFVDWKKGKFGPQAKKFKNKFMDHSMGPHEVVEQRGDNHYCIQLSKDPRVMAIFCKEDLTPYLDEDLQNLRSNFFEEGECEPSSVHKFGSYFN